MVTDAIVLSVIGSLILILVGIVGYFIKHWMATTDSREFRAIDLIEKINSSLMDLNITLSKVNTGLEVYQTGVNGTLNNMKESIERTCKDTDYHEKQLHDHEVRLTVIEKTKIRQ